MKKCIVCGKDITDEDSELFEGMCYLDFHLNFEHILNEEGNCSDPTCPFKKLNNQVRKNNEPN